jgi:hypothetical protein
MAGKRRFGVLLSLREHLQRQQRQQLEESSRQMIEAEQALFVAIRLAQRGPAAAEGEPEAQASIQPPPKTSSSRKKTAA